MELRNPRIGSAAIVKKGDKILLGIRGKEPEKGRWVLPGGGVREGETPEEAVKREILEETGLKVRIDKKIGVYRTKDGSREIHYYWASYISGKLKPSSDILEARFFTMEEVKSLVREGKCGSIVVDVLRDIGWV